jgi:hypothetical protein
MSQYAYTISYRDSEGNEHTVEGDSLKELASALVKAGYAGPILTVRDDHGFLRGWVGVRYGAAYWRSR